MNPTSTASGSARIRRPISNSTSGPQKPSRPSTQRCASAALHAGAAWVPEFLAYAKEHDAPVDFVTTHAYGVDHGFFDEKGESDQNCRRRRTPSSVTFGAFANRSRDRRIRNCRCTSPSGVRATTRATRCTTRISAQPYILTQAQGGARRACKDELLGIHRPVRGTGPPPTPFHGGFGLLTREGIRKPAFFAYKYLHSLAGKEVPSADPESLIATNESTDSCVDLGLGVSGAKRQQSLLLHQGHPTTDSAPVELTFKSLARGRYRMTVQRTGFRSNDAYTAYLEMGSPKELDARQLEQLNAHTVDKPEVERNVEIGRDGVFRCAFPCVATMSCSYG